MLIKFYLGSNNNQLIIKTKAKFKINTIVKIIVLFQQINIKKITILIKLINLCMFKKNIKKKLITKIISIKIKGK